jgi:pseudaminic acid cytidylyltransferase
MSAIALIPARGGSRRIPRKCIRSFAGLPMIAHPIKLAQASGLFDRIIVSTDDREIAEIAMGLGAEVPSMRPAELADDHTPIVEVVRHTIRELQAQGNRFEYLCRIFATAALILPEDLMAGYQRMKEGSPFAMGVKAFPHPVERRLTLDEGGRVSMVQSERFATRTQDLAVTYYDPGQFCWGTPEGFLSGVPPLLTAGTAGVVLPSHRGLDIDDEDDWLLAEAVYLHCVGKGSEAIKVD